MPSSTRRGSPSIARSRSTSFQGMTSLRAISSPVATGYAVSPPKRRTSPRGRTRVWPSSASEYDAKSIRATAWLTSWSSPVSATKSTHSGRPSASTTEPFDGSPPRTWTTYASSRSALAGRIQSRASIDSAAMALAMRFRACPARDVTPNQRVAYGAWAPR
jgi:hypothetical protein